MGAISTIILIIGIAGVGFGAGLHLGLLDDSAVMYRIQNLIPKNIAMSNGVPFFELAFMSGQSNGLINHATVGFGLGKVVMDPDEIPNNGDEYFDNRITQCEFHSNEDIDAPICLVCKLKDTHDDCVDKFLSFTEFEHGTLLSNDQGFPNAAIPGVTVSAIANTHSGGGKNALIIFDGDTPGDADENPTPDPDLRASGVCPGCAGKHIVVIAENTAGGADGIVDVPDDNAEGGMQTWVFDIPWFVKSFDFVDYDRSYNGEARAYNNAECVGTPVKTVPISKTPNGGDGSVQTITMNADNVRCLEIEYADSGGVTNMLLECVGKFHEPEKVEFFFDSFEDKSTIDGVWYKDHSRTTTPHTSSIWFGRASGGEIGAHSGQYFLGGSGNIDDLNDGGGIDWAAKNRYIDISDYTDIWLSFWYSYDNTEAADEFAMYYRIDGGAWQEIFFVEEPITNNQQVPWQYVEIGIPDGDAVEIQFRWETSAGAADDLVMIDDLKLSGVPN